ncbi:uncharacterized protein LOC130277469 [Hyla sarda]|uniref:uncharacterized protein LOC130277469 n=1 Tax=Hyla sarda TaxID=327740 RepID=UPI0024C3FD22|nr:uncharacterized protein LOC130277469 [Hyla sarda]
MDYLHKLWVEAHSILWDKSPESHKDRFLKEEAWTEIFKGLFSTWDSKTSREQGAIEETVTKRWRSLRDRFLKEYNKRVASGSGAPTAANYKYFQQLMFLAPSRELRQTESNMDFVSEEEGLPDTQETHDEQGTQTTTNEGLLTPEEQEPSLILEANEPMPLPVLLDSTDVGEDGEVAGHSESQVPRATSPIVHVTLPATRRPYQRARMRRRLHPDQELNNEIISLVHRQRTEDDSDAFGRALAERLLVMDSTTRTRCMTFILGCTEYFVPPYHPPSAPNLLLHMMTKCTPSAQNMRGEEPARRDCGTQTLSHHVKHTMLPPTRPPFYYSSDASQYGIRNETQMYGSYPQSHPPPQYQQPNIPVPPPHQQHSEVYSDFTASLRSTQD